MYQQNVTLSTFVPLYYVGNNINFKWEDLWKRNVYYKQYQYAENIPAIKKKNPSLLTATVIPQYFYLLIK